MSAVKCWRAFVCDIFHLSQGERGPLGPPGLPGFSGNPVSRLFKLDFLWLSSLSLFWAHTLLWLIFLEKQNLQLNFFSRDHQGYQG